MMLIQIGQSLEPFVGQKVSVQGQAINSKAGPLLRSGNIEIELLGSHWDTETVGRDVIVIGIVIKASSSRANFPVATQDAQGGWSQGVGGVSNLETDDPLGILSSPSTVTLPTETIVIKVLDYIYSQCGLYRLD